MRFALVLSLCGLLCQLTAYAEGDKNRSRAPRSAIQALSFAERDTLRINRRAAAQRFSAELVDLIQLADPRVREQVAASIHQVLGVDQPDGFAATATADVLTLSDLLARCTPQLQRAFAPILPQDSYDRYVALLDSYAIR